MTDRDLLGSLDRLHTTKLGEERILRNLALQGGAAEICRALITSPEAHFARSGKNWYVTVNSTVITVNASSLTIITAHKRK